MQRDFTKSGILYTWEIVSSRGAGFILYPGPHNTKKEIRAAHNEIRRSQDVVWLHNATEEDRDELYKSDIFAQPETKALEWYEIKQDEDTLRRERKKGTTPEDYVKKFVLPNVESMRELNVVRYGKHILSK